MRKIFNKLFKRVVSLNNDYRSQVSVYDSTSKKPELFTGVIYDIDFDDRKVRIQEVQFAKQLDIRTICFDDIISISRMKDGRLRMWIAN